MPEKQSEKYAREAREVFRKADLENRDATPEERGQIETLIARAEEARRSERAGEDADAFARSIGSSGPVSVSTDTTGSPGARFIRAEGYKNIAGAAGTRGERWSTGAIDVGSPHVAAKGTLTSTPGTALTPPAYQPGVVETLFQTLTVADLLSQEQTSAGQVRYVRESVATNAGTSVAEGAVKLESTLDFAEETVPIRKVATVLPVSDELLEDAPAIETYLNSRLALFVRQAEEYQLLRGNGTAPNLRGIIGASGVNTITVSGTAGTAIAENLFTVMNNTRGSSLLDPDALVVHPNTYANMRLSRDAANQYYGGGPWGPAYGGPQGQTSASQFSTGATYWGVPVVVTTAVGAGTAVVGNFTNAARLYRRGGLSVEASNSHSDYWVRNLVSLRAESRQGLAIFRPQAFTVITLT